MITTFKYKGTIIETPNLEKKLKRMKLTLQDIEIIPNKEVKLEDDTVDIDTSIIFYKWYNPITKHKHVSVIDSLPEEYNKEEWIRIS